LHGSFPIVLTSPIGHNTAGVMSDLNNRQCIRSDRLLRRLPLKVCLSNWQHRTLIDSIIDGSVDTRGRRKHNSFPTSKNNPYITKVENELITVTTRSSWIIWTDKSVTKFGITNDVNHFIVKRLFCSHNILIAIIKSQNNLNNLEGYKIREYLFLIKKRSLWKHKTHDRKGGFQCIKHVSNEPGREVDPVDSDTTRSSRRMVTSNMITSRFVETSHAR
jgi:hypothetical protein